MGFIIVLLLILLTAVAWIIRLLLNESGRLGRGEQLLSRVPRCSHCGVRQRPGMRMIAGGRAYICERCIRRAAETLDAPEDITRFL